LNDYSFTSAPQLKRAPLDSGNRSATRMTLDHLGSTLTKLLGGLVLVGLALAGLWCWSLPPAIDATRVAECRQNYAQATTHADRARVDGIVPERSGKEPTAMNCGEVRRAYPKYFN
jgi:hypothetical protein